MRLDDLGSAVADVFAPIYRDALLHRPTIVDNGKGGTTAAAIDDAPCRVQIDVLTQAQRDAGFVESEVRIIILATRLSDWLPDGRVLDDDEVHFVNGATYRLSSPTLDAIGSHWICRGRLKP